MRPLILPLVLTALLCAVLAACYRSAPPAQSPAAPAAVSATPPAVPAPSQQAQPPIPAGTEVPVASIDSVMLNRPADAPGALVIDVTATVPSSDWTNPHLIEDTGSKDPAVRIYKFVATSPSSEAAETMPQMLDTELRIDSLPPEVRSIRIVSAGNQVSAPVSE